MKRQKASYYLPPALVKRIRLAAAERGESRSDVVQRVLEAHFGAPTDRRKSRAAQPA